MVQLPARGSHLGPAAHHLMKLADKKQRPVESSFGFHHLRITPARGKGGVTTHHETLSNNLLGAMKLVDATKGPVTIKLDGHKVRIKRSK